MEAPPTQGHRDLSLDLLKACAMLFVVFFHNGQLSIGSFLDNGWMLIPMAAVPCFFMVSGAVFFHRSFDLKRHIRRTVLFYLTVVVWKAIYLGLYTSWGAPIQGSLRSLCSYLFLFQHLDGIATAHFWFMDAMLMVMLAAPFLYPLFHQKGMSKVLPGHGELLVLFLLLLGLFNQGTATGNLIISQICNWIGKPPWDISALAEISPFSFSYSNYITYYLLGGLLIEYKELFSTKISWALAGGGLLGLWVIQYLQTGSFLWQGILISGGYYWISTMILATGLFLLFTRISMEKQPILCGLARQVGGATLWIFYLHIPLIFSLTPTLFESLNQWNGWVLNLMEACLIVGISVGIGWICRRIYGWIRSGVGA